MWVLERLQVLMKDNLLVVVITLLVCDRNLQLLFNFLRHVLNGLYLALPWRRLGLRGLMFTSLILSATKTFRQTACLFASKLIVLNLPHEVALEGVDVGPLLGAKDTQSPAAVLVGNLGDEEFNETILPGVALGNILLTVVECKDLVVFDEELLVAEQRGVERSKVCRGRAIVARVHKIHVLFQHVVEVKTAARAEETLESAVQVLVAKIVELQVAILHWIQCNHCIAHIITKKSWYLQQTFCSSFIQNNIFPELEKGASSARLQANVVV
mmetsp:Transcript_54430/g.95063  ORF Transcript_54430/g.95063 Transcript_54430/m.95063 type:complete len:270 (-) Transcript_54430:4525-5334(-)